MSKRQGLVVEHFRHGQFDWLRRVLIGMTLCIVLAIGSGPSYAEDDPTILLDQTIQLALQEFIKSKDRLVDDTSAFLALLDRTIVPLFDFDRIARLVLAKHWKMASQQQRDEFAIEFKRLMIATYSSALFKYDGRQFIRILGAEIKEKKQRILATVRTELVFGNGTSPVPVDYFMIRTSEDGPWKIYNLSVAGLNMVINYRGVFQSSILEKGLTETIDSMRKSNDRFLSS
ncbi:MAG: ABC transporter substrate-binding protein [Gammaproteobacteria bacterium]|nr:ABC transporter substrate-binding protein [Gammaproteobacteria bacterium]MCY4218328.1 ABC transporter substrate-binding protein [Gammaproteobacteria bacterium]MCY4275971.1 ABC transporter substrate-binding protein [Gammaproteobacteria bacterium]